MSEMLSCCDENLCCIAPVERDVVHKTGVWHKTAHVWLYDTDGYVYFQIRSDADKLYTSASGHVMHNETPKQTAKREAFEELGINLDTDNMELIEIDAWKFDSDTKHDHAFSHIYLYKLPANHNEFNVDKNEVSGVVKIKATEILDVLLGNKQTCNQYDLNNNLLQNNKEILLMPGEIGILKYGRIMQAIVKKQI